MSAAFSPNKKINLLPPPQVADLPDLPPGLKIGLYYGNEWQKARAELIFHLDALSGEIFCKKPADGSWSLAQICDHLYLSQYRFSRIFPAILRGKFGFDQQGKFETDYQTIEQSYQSGKTVQNPPDVTPHEKDPQTGEFPEDFSIPGMKERLQTSLDLFQKNAQNGNDLDFTTRGLNHPIFGPVSVADFIWILILHEKMHIRKFEQKIRNA